MTDYFTTRLAKCLERERQIARWRQEGKTFREIGRMLGVSGVRIRQIAERALWRKNRMAIE